MPTKKKQQQQQSSFAHHFWERKRTYCVYISHFEELPEKEKEFLTTHEKNGRNVSGKVSEATATKIRQDHLHVLL